MLCCGKRQKGPRAPSSAAFEHFKAAHFGIADVLLPRNHLVKEQNNGRLSGRTMWPIGKFEIQLLFNAAHVKREQGYFDLQLPSENLQQQLDVDLGMPTGSYRICTQVHFNFMAADPGASATLSHRVLLESPYGHGLSLVFTCAQKDLEELKLLIKTIIPSLKWVDRSTVCRDASHQLHGSWRCASQVDADSPEAGMKTIIRKTAHFDEQQSFTIQEVSVQRSNDVEMSVTDDDGGDKPTILSSHAGSFELSIGPSNKATLLMVDEEYVVNEQWNHASVEEVFIEKDKLIKDGLEWYRIVE